MDISIAHSGDYGVALATESRCGIDLQRQDAALLRVQKKFCSETEYRLFETFSIDIDMTKRLNILWTAKEAAKKALSYWQMPGFLDLELRELKNSPNCIALSLHITHTKSKQMVKEVTVVASIFDEYALAICLINKVDKNARTT
jgi:phosphopantetheinyl transferase